MKGLTYKQKLFLDSLQQFINESGYTPTIREMCEFVGLNSPATVHTYLKILAKKGYIERKNNRKIVIRSVNNGNSK